MRASHMGVLISSLSGAAGSLSANIQRTPRGYKTIFRSKLPRPRTPKLPGYEPECPCQAFTLCDALYQAFTPDELALWRAAIKRPFTSTYDLYMRECLTLTNAGHNAPDVPGPSGGYSALEAVPGTVPAPAPCIPAPSWCNPPAPNPCDYCNFFTPRYWTFVVPDPAPPCYPAPGSHTVYDHLSYPCMWARTLPAFYYQIDVTASWFTLRILNNALGWTYLRAPTPPDCGSAPITVTRYGGTGTCRTALPAPALTIAPGWPCS